MSNVIAAVDPPTNGIASGDRARLSVALVCLVYLGIQFAAAVSGVGDAVRDQTVASLAAEALIGAIRFLGAVLAATILVRSGYRVWVAITCVVVSLALIQYSVGGMLLRPLGIAWTPAIGTADDSPAWVARPTLGVAIELILLVIACLAAGTRIPQPRMHAQLKMRIAAATVCVAALIMARAVASPDAWAASGGSGRYAAMAALLVLGYLGGGNKSRLRWLLLLFPLLTTLDWISLFLPEPSLARVLSPTIPYVTAVGLGLLIYPLAERLGKAQKMSPRVLLILVISLNAIDAVLTWSFVSSNEAAELNPVVRLIGLPGKVAVVTIAATLVYRFRPSALVWPVTALGVVICWHVVGLWLLLG